MSDEAKVRAHEILIAIDKTVKGVITRTGQPVHEIRMSAETIETLSKIATYPTEFAATTVFGIPVFVDESIPYGQIEPRYYYPKGNHD